MTSVAGDRFPNREDLRRLLAEDDVERRDRSKTRARTIARITASTLNAELEEQRLEHLREERLAHPAEPQARQRDAELACAER